MTIFYFSIFISSTLTDTYQLLYAWQGGSNVLISSHDSAAVPYTSELQLLSKFQANVVIFKHNVDRQNLYKSKYLPYYCNKNI